MGINHNRRVLFWWQALFAADTVSFAAASQLSCQILPCFRYTRESGFSCAAIQTVGEGWSGLPWDYARCESSERDRGGVYSVMRNGRPESNRHSRTGSLQSTRANSNLL